jgi:hypothetical protein
VGGEEIRPGVALLAANAIVVVAVQAIDIHAYHLEGPERDVSLTLVTRAISRPPCTIHVRSWRDGRRVVIPRWWWRGWWCLCNVEGDAGTGATSRAGIWAGIYDSPWNVFGRSEWLDAWPQVSDT